MASNSNEAPKNPSLEEAMAELEKIVQELEKGAGGLGEGLKRFEEGVKLYQICRESLEQTEKKVKLLTDSLKEEDWRE